MNDTPDPLLEALNYLDKISPAGWHVERAREVLIAALAVRPAADTGLRGADIRRAVAASSPLIDPRLSEIDWDDVAYLAQLPKP